LFDGANFAGSAIIPELSGPIRHSNKTSFLFSVSRKEEDLQAVVVAAGLSGSEIWQ